MNNNSQFSRFNPSFCLTLIINPFFLSLPFLRATTRVLLWVLADCSCKNSKVLPYSRPSKSEFFFNFGHAYLLTVFNYIYSLFLTSLKVST